MLENFCQTLDVFEKFLNIVLTPVHLDFLTFTPCLLPLPASDKASLFPSLLAVLLHNGTRCGRLQCTFISVILRRRGRATHQVEEDLTANGVTNWRRGAFTMSLVSFRWTLETYHSFSCSTYGVGNVGPQFTNVIGRRLRLTELV